MSESVAALEKAGHECVAIDPPDILEAMRIFVALTGGDGFQRLLSQLHGDKAEPHLFLIRLQSALGPTWTHFSAWLSSFTDPISSSVVSASGLKPVAHVIDWQDKRNNFSDTERKRFFDELKLDAIVSPVQASPAVKCTTSWSECQIARGLYGTCSGISLCRLGLLGCCYCYLQRHVSTRIHASST